MNVDTTHIGEAFRPTGALSEVLYRDTGDNHPYQRISQHGVTPFGVKIELDVGQGSGFETIWKWHTNGTLYDYQMNITKLYGDVPGVFSSAGTTFNSDTAPYYIIYDAPVYWDASSASPSGEMKATLVPKQYLISFDLNADGDTVTVNVGSIEHPMSAEHSILWVALETDKGVQRKYLEVGNEPKVEFVITGDKARAVYAYCNLHGLWKTEI